jgi:type IX secretion system PorP/SprF family membrane protein
MIKRVILFVFVALACMQAKAQQDAQFSQYIFNGLYINPAYAGYKSDFFINSFFRSQWTGLNGAPQTVSVAGDGAVADDKVGLGLLVSNDRLGAQSNSALYANYAYRIQIGQEENSRLAFGVGLGFIQTGINGSKLNPTQGGDTYVPVGNQSNIIPDGRVGILYTNDNFFAGISVDNLLAQFVKSANTNANLIPVPKPHQYVTVGALFEVAEDVKFKPSILIKDTQTAPTSMDINAFVLLSERLWLGASYRTAIDIYNKPNLPKGMQKASAAIAMAEFFVTPSFRVGYAYDYSLNKLGAYGYGSHEISISFMIKNRNNTDPTRKCYF